MYRFYCCANQKVVSLCAPGGNQALHGPGGVGGGHQLPARLFPQDRYVCGRAGAVGAGGPLHCIWWYECVSCCSSKTVLTSHSTVVSVVPQSFWILNSYWQCAFKPCNAQVVLVSLITSCINMLPSLKHANTHHSHTEIGDRAAHTQKHSGAQKFVVNTALWLLLIN